MDSEHIWSNHLKQFIQSALNYIWFIVYAVFYILILFQDHLRSHLHLQLLQVLACWVLLLFKLLPRT